MNAPLFYRRSGQGPPLMLLHGYASSSLFWDPLRHALESHLDVIAPDWPGFGGSASQSPYQSVQEFAQGIIALADQLGLERFHVAGHSMGGFPVQELLLRFPHRLLSATLYGAGLRVDKTRRFETLEQTLARLAEQGAQASSLPVLKKWFFRPEQHPDAFELCRRALEGLTPEGAAAALRAFDGVDYSGRLDHVQVPTLVILGQHERSHPLASALELVQAIAQANLCVLPDSAHAVHLEKPELFTLALIGFLRQHQDEVHSACR